MRRIGLRDCRLRVSRARSLGYFGAVCGLEIFGWRQFGITGRVWNVNFQHSFRVLGEMSGTHP